jgi:protein involved in sex pheromone biosynthesis
MSRLFILLSLASALMLSSCETTGDPNEGGLFGWSQSKANVRSDMMKQDLQDIEADTEYQRDRTRELQRDRAARQRELNRLEE